MSSGGRKAPLSGEPATLVRRICELVAGPAGMSNRARGRELAPLITSLASHGVSPLKLKGNVPEWVIGVVARRRVDAHLHRLGVRTKS